MRKVTEPDFSEKFSFAQKREKRAQNGLNLDFFVNLSKLCHYCFLIFFMKLGYHKHSKVTWPIFPEKCRLIKKVPKWPKMFR